MTRSILMLLLKAYSKHLSGRLPPSGRPPVVLLEARAYVVVNAALDGMAQGAGPDVGVSPGALTADKVRTGIDFVFATLADAYSGDDWARAFCQLGRLYGMDHAEEILAEIANPSKTLDSGPQRSL